MSKFVRKTIITAKIETTPGTDSVPTGAANAILVRNCTITPLDITQEDRNIIRGFFGNYDSIPTIRKVKLSFECELAGSGTAGTAPAYGPLLQACGTTEALVAVTSATYTPNSLATTAKSVSIYYNVDGLNHKLLYGRGNVKMNFKANGIPFLSFDLIGLDGGAADIALPTPTYTAFGTPLAVNATNTPTITVLGTAVALESLMLDMGNQVQQISRPGATDQILQTDRKTVGSVMFEMTSVATKDWLTAAKTPTLGALNLVHGVAAGKILTLAAPNIQLTQPQFSDIQGIQMVQFTLKYNPSNSGNDEFTLANT